jgi:hypothetical protein
MRGSSCTRSRVRKRERSLSYRMPIIYSACPTRIHGIPHRTLNRYSGRQKSGCLKLPKIHYHKLQERICRLQKKTVRIESVIGASSQTHVQVFWIVTFAALTAVGARFEIFQYPVPFTLQTMFVLLAGAFLGARNGALSQILYLGVGAVGLPVFAAGGAMGILRLIGPTGGYLLAFSDRGVRDRLPSQLSSRLSLDTLLDGGRHAHYIRNGNYPSEYCFVSKLAPGICRRIPDFFLVGPAEALCRGKHLPSVCPFVQVRDRRDEAAGCCFA